MAAVENVLFIINPKSGVKKKDFMIEAIASVFIKNINHKIIWWEKGSDIRGIIRKEIQENSYDIVVAVGGDGTVNIVASVLINTPVALGVIPLGSGNGFAHHMGIPLNINKALDVILNGKTTMIDSCLMNDRKFVCTCGVGFDAHISHVFSQVMIRGFFSYTVLTLKEFFKYKPKEYILNLDGKEIKREAFVITFANANQYGNNVFIAPYADIQDGIIEVTLVKRIHLFNAFALAYRLFKKTIHHSKFVETFQAKEISLQMNNDEYAHFDGEPVDLGRNIQIKNIQHSLKVVIP